LLHAWRLPALRALAVLRGARRLPLVASCVRNKWPDSFRFGELDRWLLRRARSITAHGPWEAGRLRRLGLGGEQVVELPLAVAPPVSVASRAEVSRGFGLPDDSRWLVTVGPLARQKGYRDAIWAFDLLRHPHAQLHLLVIGQGPDRPRLERFARAIQIDDRVHFVGAHPDVPSLLAAAEAVWIAGRVEAGHNVALEAMAAASPVLASRLPGLAGIVVEGETGFLIRPGDKAGLARQTRRLMEDASLRGQLGEAGRQRVARSFALTSAVARLGELYDGLMD
jgi:glycosyltransferase involved in cell wall biosynthesis